MEQDPWRHGLFSDWTLIISGHPFPVHRYVVGLGPRSSPMLKRLFLSETFLDQGDRSTAISLEHDCPPSSSLSLDERRHRFIDAGATVLSYMYFGLRSTHLDPKLLMPIWRLADYLCLTALCQAIQESINDSANPNNIADILSDAECFGLGEICAQVCARRIARRFIIVNNDVWDRLPPKFLSSLLRSPSIVAPHNAVSERLAHYLQRNRTQREHRNQLVLSLLENPRHQVSPNDSAFFLSLDIHHNPLITIVAEHFEMFSRDRLCQLSPEVFARVICSPELRSSSRFLNLTLIRFYRANWERISIDLLSRLLSVASFSSRAELAVMAAAPERAMPGAMAVFKTALSELLDIAPRWAVVPDRGRFVTIGHGIWIRNDDRDRVVAFESPSTDGSVRLIESRKGERDEPVELEPAI